MVAVQGVTHYRIVEPEDQDAARVLDVLAWLTNDREMQRDRERLVNACCAPQLPISIQGAPPRPLVWLGRKPDSD